MERILKHQTNHLSETPKPPKPIYKTSSRLLNLVYTKTTSLIFRGYILLFSLIFLPSSIHPPKNKTAALCFARDHVPAINQEHNGHTHPRQDGKADADVCDVFVFLETILEIWEMDIYKCPFLKFLK